MFEARLASPAREFFAALSADQKRDVRQIIHLIELDPSVDDQNKFSISFPPLVLAVYVDLMHWIVYHVTDSATVSIYNIGWSWDQPPRLR